MSDQTPASATPSSSISVDDPDEGGEYVFRQIVGDDEGISFEDAIAGTIVEFEDGDIVTGTVVKVDKDEVLLDIGYKSEG
ncbi:MAG TPA: 30S ribosomal protein S1, partial [Acidimicrobiales bacterium]|nr:30S ribosomal protein S1 [Acidimicrobiales bacterium]